MGNSNKYPDDYYTLDDLEQCGSDEFGAIDDEMLQVEIAEADQESDEVLTPREKAQVVKDLLAENALREYEESIRRDERERVFAALGITPEQFNQLSETQTREQARAARELADRQLLQAEKAILGAFVMFGFVIISFIVAIVVALHS